MKQGCRKPLTICKVASLLVFILFQIDLLADQKVLEIIELSGRPAAEIANIVRPLLDRGETVVSHGALLILKIDPSNIRELRRLVAQLDVSPHRLMISVLQGKDISVDELNARARINVNIGGRDKGGGSVRARGHFYQTESDSTLGTTQKLQTLEGIPAVIKVGEEYPVPNYSTHQYGNQTVISGGLEYREATTGFSVIPRLVGREVNLEISPWSDHRSTLGNGRVDVQSAQTTVRVLLGEWVELGGVTETESFEQRGTLSRSHRTRKKNNRIFVKVEDLDASKR